MRNEHIKPQAKRSALKRLFEEATRIFAHARRILAIALSLALAMSMLVVPVAEAAPGDLDRAFGGSGIVRTDFGAEADDEAGAVAVQSDGKIVVVGSTRAARSFKRTFAVARYNSNGTLDATFGVGGKVVTNVAGDNFSRDSARDVVLLPDGRILVVGVSAAGFALARYNCDGALNNTFGIGGLVRTDFGPGTIAEANAAAVQPDGKIVVVGLRRFLGNTDIAIARYNADGTPDQTFGADGKNVESFGGNEGATDVVLQSDGKIVVSVSVEFGGDFDFAVARFESNGLPDITFGAQGLARIRGPSNEEASALAFHIGGKIVAVGRNFDRGQRVFPKEFLVWRFNSNGTVDTAFGQGGRAIVDFPGQDAAATAVVVEPQRPKGDPFPSRFRIVVAGSAITRLVGGPHFALARFDSNGTLDATFGRGGTVTTSLFGFNLAANGAALQPNNNVVAVGVSSARTVPPGPANFVVARYLWQ
ncbi:MAG: hypothetical protein HY675_13875 [Chloroflexi bacterium]|nr:hypothetical protein [Chloroflexota bacterium]